MLVEAGERVVHHRERALRARKLRDGRDVRDLRHRVRRALEEHELRRPRGELALNAIDVFDGKHRVRHTEPTEQPANEIAARVVRLDEADDVIARLRQREQRLRDGAHAGGGDEAIVPALQLRDSELELPRRGIGRARIEKPRPFAAQVLHRLIERIELELDGLVDGRDDRMVVRRQLDTRADD